MATRLRTLVATCLISALPAACATAAPSGDAAGGLDAADATPSLSRECLAAFRGPCDRIRDMPECDSNEWFYNCHASDPSLTCPETRTTCRFLRRIALGGDTEWCCPRWW